MIDALPESCLACQSPLRARAAFCARCGCPVGQATPAPVAPTTGSLPPSADGESAWSNLKGSLEVFGLLLATSFASIIARKVSDSPWIDVVESGLDTLLVLGFVAREWPAVRAALPARTLIGHEALGVLVSAATVTQVYFFVLQSLGVRFLRYTDQYLAMGWPTWVSYALVVAQPAIVEELAFRGVIFARLERAFTAREVWLVQAAMFSVLHLMPLMFPSHFVLGLAFGWLRARSGSVLPGMLAHALWNGWIVWRELAERGAG